MKGEGQDAEQQPSCMQTSLGIVRGFDSAHEASE